MILKPRNSPAEEIYSPNKKQPARGAMSGLGEVGQAGTNHGGDCRASVQHRPFYWRGAPGCLSVVGTDEPDQQRKRISFFHAVSSVVSGSNVLGCSPLFPLMLRLFSRYQSVSVAVRTSGQKRYRKRCSKTKENFQKPDYLWGWCSKA